MLRSGNSGGGGGDVASPSPAVSNGGDMDDAFAVADSMAVVEIVRIVVVLNVAVAVVVVGNRIGVVVGARCVVE